MSDSTWEYNCPQFVDFSAPIVDDPNVDAYFNFDHENGEHLEEESEVSADIEEASLYEDARADETPAPCKSGTPCRRESQSAGRKTPKTPMSTSKRQAVRTPRSEAKTSPYNMRSKKNVESPTKNAESPQESVKDVKSEVNQVCTASEDNNTPQPVPANLCTSLSAWRSKCSTSQSRSEPSKKSPARARRGRRNERDQTKSASSTPVMSLETGTGEAHKSEREEQLPTASSTNCGAHELDHDVPSKEEVEVNGKTLRVPPNLCTSLSAWRNNSTKVVSQSKPVRKSPRVTKGGLRSAKQKERRMKSSTPDVNAGSKHSPAAKRQRRSLVPSVSEDDTCSTPQSQRRQTLSLERSTPGVKPPSINHANAVVNNISLDSQGNQSLDGSIDENDKTTEKSARLQHTRKNSASLSLKGRHTRSLSSQRDRRHLRSNSIKRTSFNEKDKEKKEIHMPFVKPKLTMPMTPTCLKRKGPTSTTSVKTTEEMEMERIKLLRQELANKRKIAKESLQKAQTSSGYVPVRSKIRLTRTEDIHFATDDRIKSHHTETNSPDPIDFVSGLRNLSSQPHTFHHGPTVPQPFNLTENRKRKREKDTGYQTTAEIVRGFALKTPDRFHTRSKKDFGSSPSKRSKQSSHHAKLTVPKTPNLETRGRKRHVYIISHQEIEEKEIEEMKNFKFKANPVNTKIMSHPNVGVKFVQPKESTQAIGFDLETENRRVLRSHNKLDKSDNTDEEHYEFHAQPIPKGILQGPVGLKPGKDVPLTIPESPAFALKNRLRQHFKEVIQEENKTHRARPVPHSGLPFQPKLEHRVTEPQPFSFENRQQFMKEHKEKMIQQALEEEKKAREFRAKPLPDLSPELPSKSAKPPTKPQPFVLEVDVRGAIKAEEWSHKMEEELEQQRQMANAFKARSSKVLYQEPFIPKQSTKPLTDINDIRLNTNSRAGKRAEWEMYVKQLEADAAAEEAARERERLEEERREVDRLRKEAVHKPQPIKKYKPVEVKPSDKPLTDPHTPKFSDRLKTRSLRT